MRRFIGLNALKPFRCQLRSWDRIDTVALLGHSVATTPPLRMPHPKIPGFITRANAQKTYRRSKASFIRDIDSAFDRNDLSFLNHFRVALNDGTQLNGKEATKEALLTLQAKQPRWYVEVAFLESRYWDGPDTQTPEKESEDKSSVEPIEDGLDSGLQHRLDLAEQQIASQDQTIVNLEADKRFLQSELENRRGEIDKLRGFFESVGDAADSTAKLRNSGEPREVLEVSSKPIGKSPREGSRLVRHLPTFHRFFQSVISR
ncbi:hypothetical protein [Rubinisphaera italica]|uniref:hypothetical protein n=1 Tax=Rubinisphaera italica TaxID=2527969 RepID=UPI0011B4D1F2|nr:hypothetical protein [Rubinisphaera italica]